MPAPPPESEPATTSTRGLVASAIAARFMGLPYSRSAAAAPNFRLVSGLTCSLLSWLTRAEAAAVSDNPEDTAKELVGKTLGEGYRLDALIGQGAMGAVYSATTATGAQVAVKTLTPQVMG